MVSKKTNCRKLQTIRAGSPNFEYDYTQIMNSIMVQRDKIWLFWG